MIGLLLDGLADSEFLYDLFPQHVLMFAIRYITRSDDSPLMDALVFWRNDSIKAREQGAPSRPVSPLPSDLEPPRYTSDDEPLSSDEGDDPRHAPSNLPPSATRKPTSSSWVRWWSRSRNSGGPDIAGASGGRPALRGSASDPLGTVSAGSLILPLPCKLIP